MPRRAGGIGPLSKGSPLPVDRLALLSRGVLAIGVPAAALAIGLAPHDAAAAAAQSWPAFVLVAGLLLLGLVAGADGLFEAAGRLVARVGGSHGVVLLAASSVLIAVVSAVLNLDTAVTFLTPVVIVAARRRSMAVEPFCYLTVLLANAGSLLLPGSNLTNLIVLGTSHVSGSTFTLHMLPAWIAAAPISAKIPAPTIAPMPMAVTDSRPIVGAAPGARIRTRSPRPPGAPRKTAYCVRRR